MIRSLCIGLFLALGLSASLLDRIDIIVGADVITELQLQEEIAVTGFLNRTPPVSNLVQRRAAAHRLVQQTLIARDMKLAQFPPVDAVSVERAFAQTRALFADPGIFNAELTRYHLGEGTLKRHLEIQIAVLRFIEYRFRPELTISDSDLEDAYERQSLEWKQQNPKLQPARDELRSKLIDERTDRALDSWLQQAGMQTRIVYVDAELKVPQ